MTRDELIAGLPGEALVREGIADLESGRRTIAALLVSVARTRLSRAGLLRRVEIARDEPELELYRLLRREGGDAYSRYNALIRELTSFGQALERRVRTSGEGPTP